MDKAPEAFRTISEVADELEVPKHVLRFWEARFAQLKPMKRGGGRRYYRPEDLELLRGIRHLLHAEGYTIKGVQKILREHGPRYVMDFRRIAEEQDQDDVMSKAHEIPDVAAEAAQSRSFGRPPGLSDQGEDPDAEDLDSVLKELEDCRRILTSAKGS